MSIKKNSNAVNQVEKNSIIYDFGEQVDSISLILKGRVIAEREGSKVILGSGNFIGSSDLNVGKYQSTYIAYEDVMLFCYPVKSNDELVDIFVSNKDYKGLMVASLTRYVNELASTYTALQQTGDRLYQFIETYHNNYLEMGKRLGYMVNEVSSITDLDAFDSDYIVDERKLNFYKEGAKLPVDVWKAFCAQGDNISFYFIEEMQELIKQLLESQDALAKYVLNLSECLFSNRNDCLYKSYAALAINIEESGGYNGDLIDVIDKMVELINYLDKLFNEKIGLSLSIDRKKMEEIYYLLLTKKSGRKEQVNNNFLYSEDESKEVDVQLANSFEKIHEFAGQTNEKKEELKSYIIDYMNLKDKRSVDDSTRMLRRRIMGLFYELYEMTFFKAMNVTEIPKVVDLFLSYGFLDEKVLNNDQLKELYYLDKLEDNDKVNSICKTYNLKEWLISIYKGENEPSKTEFDLEYVDVLRENKKRGEITVEQERKLLADTYAKTKHEIQNLFRYNHRLVSGQLSTFVPFLNSENFIRSVREVYITKQRVDDAIRAILDIDYSIFHREVLYVNKEKGIEKEYIMKQVPPNIIILPAYGTTAIMWQDISGKKKSNPGRILLPAFSDLDLKEILIKTFGRYRWELCRSIQGNAWNNIKEKSLTSEYADYIQFYRKNRDLSEEVKEKVKNQIQKGKGNYREIFAIDYENWIKGEAKGGIKLNKVSREILATYCPFSKPIREKVKTVPLIADAMARYYRNKAKTVKEIENRMRAIEKEGGVITEELMENYTFHKDL